MPQSHPGADCTPNQNPNDVGCVTDTKPTLVVLGTIPPPNHPVLKPFQNEPVNPGYTVIKFIFNDQNHGMQTDALHRFLFEGSNIRGEIVRLERSWQTLLARQNYPPAVRRVLGQATAAGVLLAATIKFDGSLTLQLNTDGRLKFLVVECTGEQHLRGLARWRGDIDNKGNDTLLGAGQLVMTIDQGADSERYQSIIELDGEGLTSCLDSYFQRSEQLPTRIWLAADAQRAAGLLIQEMPRTQAATDTDLWNRVTTLAATVTDNELLNLNPQQLLQRLFHEETVRVFKPKAWTSNCPCSRERVDSMLHSLGRDALQATLDERGRISVACEFCGQAYHFDAVDVKQILCTDSPFEQVSRTRH